MHSDGISQHDGEVKGLAIPKKHKLLKHAQQVPPTLSLVHKEHRNRMMLNHWNVHKKGAGIYGIGADLKQLSVAICAELAPHGQTREDQLQANQNLLKKAGGLLAPISGDEQYLSLGCSHTVAFCKLLEHGVVGLQLGNPSWPIRGQLSTDGN